MDVDHEKFSLFQRRSFLIGGVKGLLLTGIFARMGYLQIFQSQKYKMMADDNRINVRPISPSRGHILSLDEAMLARNDQNFRVFFLREKADDTQKTITKFTQLLGLDQAEYERIMKTIQTGRGYYPILIKEKLKWEQVSQIEYALPYLPGVFMDVGEIRTYPKGQLLSHIIGYVSSVSREDQQKNSNPIYSVPGIKLGKTGIERGYDQFLRGKPGMKQVEVNAFGRMARELNFDPGEAGKKMRLTINLALQEKVHSILRGQKSASCIVMDIHTGAVYASVSHPSYDPNLFVQGLSEKQWEGLVNDPAFPLANKVIAGQYSPGSLFKMVVLISAFENKVITANHHVDCKGFMDVGNQRFHCVHRKGCGVLGPIRAIQRSCDTYFYDIAQKLTIDQIAKTARSLGYGQNFNLGLTGENPGLMPDRAWKMRRYKKPWLTGDSMNASIGQGFILSSPIQIAVMLSRLVNGGKAVIPRFVHAIGEERIAPPDFPLLNIKGEHLALVIKGMNAALKPGGTGTAAQLDDPNFQLGGKTATTQVKRITMEEREKGLHGNYERPWHLRDHAMFTTFGPTKDPKYAAVMIIDHGGFGGSVAGPLMKRVMQACRDLNPQEESSQVKVS